MAIVESPQRPHPMEDRLVTTSIPMEETVEEITQKPLLNRLIDAANFHDNINYRDPLGWDTLRDRWVNKTIGKDWREEQMSDIWDLLPDEWKPAVKEGATKFGQAFAEGWQDRRTIEGKEFLNPLAYTDFAITRGLETIGIPFEWMAQGISKASGLDIELARIATDFVPVAGIAGAVGKKINKARLAKRISLLQKTPLNKTEALRAAIKSGDKVQMEAAIKAITEPSEELARARSLKAKLDDSIDNIVKGTFQGKSYYSTTLRQTSPPNIVGQSWETRKAAAELTDSSRVTRKVDKAFTKQGMDIWKLWTTSTPELKGLPVAIHHKGPLKQVATAVKHLDTPYALEASNYMAKRLRHRLGTTIEQATPLPSGVGQNIHNRIHGYLNSILGDSSSGLLSKLEAKYKVKLSDLELYDPRYIQILDDLTDTIAESYEHIDSFWRSLANRTDLDKVTKEEWFASALDINKVDELYRTVISKKQKGPVGQTPSNIIDRIVKRTNFALETAVVLTNKTNISPNAGIAKVLRMNRGWEALREAVLTNKTAEQIYKQYGIKTVSLKTFKKVVNSLSPKDIERARRGGIPGGPDLSPGMFADD